MFLFTAVIVVVLSFLLGQVGKFVVKDRRSSGPARREVFAHPCTQPFTAETRIFNPTPAMVVRNPGDPSAPSFPQTLTLRCLCDFSAKS